MPLFSGAPSRHAVSFSIVCRQFYLVNAVKTAREVSLDISDWSVLVGAKVLITEISKRYMNQVSSFRRVITHPAGCAFGAFIALQ